MGWGDKWTFLNVRWRLTTKMNITNCMGNKIMEIVLKFFRFEKQRYFPKRMLKSGFGSTFTRSGILLRGWGYFFQKTVGFICEWIRIGHESFMKILHYFKKLLKIFL